MFRVGFRASNPIAYRLFNVAIAAALIVATLPLLALISAALFFTQGRKVFYRGARLGENQRTFHILKFRTLCHRRATAMTQTCTLPRGAQ
ncbi:MAG: sugar transferase, partial [Pseudomonadota bacterium]